MAPPSILIIEDEPSIADNICYALKTDGFETHWCATGAEGKRALNEKKFQLLVLDVGLPDQSGFDLCREIRKTQTIPILFLTARSGEIDRVVGLEIGADDYMVKPFSPRELSARVRAILRRTGGTPAPQPPAEKIRYGPFELDEGRNTAFFYKTPLTLSPYEFRILKVFLTRPGRVFSRDQLMDLAWEEPEASLDRTVDAHIKGIRAKLKQIRHDEEAILTHRGLGYALKEYL